MKVWMMALMFMGTLGLAHADSLVWDTPYGKINLNLTATEVVTGYDAILKQGIAGASLPVYTLPHNIAALQIGAVAAWPSSDSVVEPYISAGHDLAREIPLLAQFQSLHVNVFGRYATEQGKAGAGVSVSYAFML